MNCAEFDSRYLESGPDSEIEAHAETCARCASLLPDLAGLRAVLDDPAVWEAPSDDLEDLVVNSIRATSPLQPRRWSRWVIPAAAVLAIVVAVSVWAITRSPAPNWEFTLTSEEGATAIIKGWTYPAGTTVFIETDGLAPAAEGSYYEFWLGNDESVISGGTFSYGERGVQMYVAGTRADYPRMGITLEPRDNDPAPSGVVVFRMANG